MLFPEIIPNDILSSWQAPENDKLWLLLWFSAANTQWAKQNAKQNPTAHECRSCVTNKSPSTCPSYPASPCASNDPLTVAAHFHALIQLDQVALLKLIGSNTSSNLPRPQRGILGTTQTLTNSGKEMSHTKVPTKGDAGSLSSKSTLEVLKMLNHKALDPIHGLVSLHRTHTPWKINMEHNHRGLEDYFPF